MANLCAAVQEKHPGRTVSKAQPVCECVCAFMCVCVPLNTCKSLVVLESVLQCLCLANKITGGCFLAPRSESPPHSLICVPPSSSPWDDSPSKLTDPSGGLLCVRHYARPLVCFPLHANTWVCVFVWSAFPFDQLHGSGREDVLICFM